LKILSLFDSANCNFVFVILLLLYNFNRSGW